MSLNEQLCHIAREAEAYLNKGEVKHCRSFLEAFVQVWDMMTEEERKHFTDCHLKIKNRMDELTKKLTSANSTALDMFHEVDSQ